MAEEKQAKTSGKSSEKKYDKMQAEKKAEETKEKSAIRAKQALMESEVLVRILGYDIPGSRNLYAGLTRIKGISWSIANAVCLKLGLPRNKKVSELTKDDIKKIESFLKELPVYNFLKNRRLDPLTGETSHFYGTDLDMKREFDIKRLKEIKSYRGLRHALKQPVRGQRTRSHFRTKGRPMGVRKKKE